MRTAAAVVLTCGLAAAASPPLTHTEQVRPPSGRPVQVRRVACAAPGRPSLAATLTLQDAGPLHVQVMQLATNAAGTEVLTAGRSLPQIQPHYRRYVTQGQPVSHVTLAALISAWRLFGLKFDWKGATYRCTLS